MIPTQVSGFVRFSHRQGFLGAELLAKLSMRCSGKAVGRGQLTVSHLILMQWPGAEPS